MELYVFSQYVSAVPHFSGEYGDGITFPGLYAASSLIGKPNHFPIYGDSSLTYSLPCYGTWWQECPSAIKSVAAQNPLQSVAFVDVKYELAVFPHGIHIFETHQCGSVVRIFGRNSQDSGGNHSWFLLWSGFATPNLPAKARNFSPPLRNINSPIDIVRIEMDSSRHLYYPQIDAVLLTGNYAKHSSHSKISQKDLFRKANILMNNPFSCSTTVRDNRRTRLIPVVSEDELQSLNVCNKILSYGLQNYMRSFEDVVSNGTDYIGGEKIEDLINLFSSPASEFTHDDSLFRTSNDIPNKFIPQAADNSFDESSLPPDLISERVAGGGLFAKLPPEIILRILSYLELPSLCRVAQTCSTLKSLAYERRLYTRLCLKEWWWLINDSAMNSLSNRIFIAHYPFTSEASGSGSLETTSGRDHIGQEILSRMLYRTRSQEVFEHNLEQSGDQSVMDVIPSPDSVLTELDMSWCGLYGDVSVQSFCTFLQSAGCWLRLLRVSCCDFIDNYCLYIIGNVCVHLSELDISRCQNVDLLGFGELNKCTKLQRLNASYTSLATNTLQVVLQNTPNLQHLGVDGCSNLDLNEICPTLARFVPNLISFSAWKGRGLSNRGMRALSDLVLLEDLNLGWALMGGPFLSASMIALFRQCKKLKRLLLTSARYFSDIEVTAIADFCHDLQQLDLVGNSYINPEPLTRLLTHCRHMRLLDVNYCARITSDVIRLWMIRFPRVNFRYGDDIQILDEALD